MFLIRSKESSRRNQSLKRKKERTRPDICKVEIEEPPHCRNAVIIPASRSSFLHFFLHTGMDQGLVIMPNSLLHSCSIFSYDNYKHVCHSSLLNKMVLEKIGSCIHVSSEADSLIWRVEVTSAYEGGHLVRRHESLWVWV